MCQRAVLRCATIFRACTGTNFSTRTKYQKWTKVVQLYSILFVILNSVSTVRLFINRASFWVTHCHQKCALVRREISGSGFLDVNWYSVVHPIGLRRVFLCCVNISTQIFDDNVSFPVEWWVVPRYGQNLPYKFKIKIPVHNCHSEADYLVSGPYHGSALVRVMVIKWHPALVVRHGNIETEIFLVTTRGV